MYAFTPLLPPAKTYVVLGTFWFQSLTSKLKGDVDKAAFPTSMPWKRDPGLPAIQLTLGLCFFLFGL